MKIAIYHNLLSGGAKRALFEYVRRLSSVHDFDVYSLSTGNHTFADLRPFVKKHAVFPFQPGRLFRSPFGRLNQVVRSMDLLRIRTLNRAIASKIDMEGYDLVFVNPCQTENSPSVLSYLQAAPTIFYCQEPLRILYEEMPSRPYDRVGVGLRQKVDRLDPLPGLFRNLLKKRDAGNLRAADRVLVNSAFIRQSVARIYQVEAHVGRLGVDTELFQPQAVEKQDYVLSVGSLTPLKGFDFLIRALGQIPLGQRPPLVIASNFQNPPELAYLNQLAHNLGVNVNFLGNINDNKLVCQYNQARVTLYAPVREPLGLVAIESMACGTPLVAVREGGIMETVPDGQAGWLTERNERAFADAVQRLYHQPERLAEFGEYGRKHVLAHWTWDVAVQNLSEHFKQVLQAG